LSVSQGNRLGELIRECFEHERKIGFKTKMQNSKAPPAAPSGVIGSGCEAAG
jgi:hypothetical protein